MRQRVTPNPTYRPPQHPAGPTTPLPSLSGLLFFLSKSWSQEDGAHSSQEKTPEPCATLPSAHPFYLGPASLATGQELGREQRGSQAWGLLAAGTRVRGLDLALGSQGTVWRLAF